jgi:hypothetical protein
MARGGPLVVMEMARGGPIVVMEMANDKADDLSSNRLSSFLSKVPEADDRPTQIPPWLEQLGTVTGEWTNKTWVRWLRDSFVSPSPLPLDASTVPRRTAT